MERGREKERQSEREIHRERYTERERQGCIEIEIKGDRERQR